MKPGVRTLFDGDRRRPLLGGGEKLRFDVDRPTGFSDKANPQTVEEAVALLTPQLEEVREAVASTPMSMRGSRVVIEAKVLPNYLAGTYFPAKLFSAAKLEVVGVRVGRGEYRTKTQAEERETKNYLLAGDEASLERFARILRGDIEKSKSARDAYDSLRRFDMLRFPGTEQTLRGERPTTDDPVTWEAVFHPVLDEQGGFSLAEREDVWGKWLALVGRLGGEVAVQHRHEVDDLLFVPVRLSSAAATEAASFNPLRVLRPMPSLEPAPVVELRDLGQAGPDPPPGAAPQSDLRVAVFDGGADQGAVQLAPFVQSTDLTNEPPLPQYVNHGTLVTASVLFGADHGDGTPLETPEVGVDHYRVLPAPSDPVFDLDLVSVLDLIEQTVTEKGYRIVNLSIGPRVPLEDDQEPHAWTARLDALAERHGVLFVTAVGNDGDADPASGAHRIQVPSDMVNGIGVGACDARPSQVSWARASYSSVGPGRPGARMQPTGVAFGGVPGRPFRGIGAGGSILHTAGTSFATPTAVHGLSALAAQLRPEDWDPSVLRAFAAQYAEAPGADPLHDEVGFGRLVERYDEMLECEPSEATILYRDEIERGKMISLPIPLPAGALLGRDLTISWSIAFASPTDAKNPIDYTQASLEARFRPHDRRFRFSKEKPKRAKVLDLDQDHEFAAQLLAEGYSQSGLPVSDGYTSMRPEGLLRSEDGKWETILRASKTKRASNLLRPQITVLYLARQGGDLAPGPPLRFAMLANLRAAPGVPLYDEIRSQYPVLSPIRTQLPVRITT